MKGLKDRVCIITGAANGIGEATARVLSSYGACLALLDRDEEALLKVSTDIEGKGGEVIFANRCDIGNANDLREVARRLEKDALRVGSLVNVAATFKFDTLSQDFADWELTMRNSVASYAVFSSMLKPLMYTGSSIVNMSSISALIAQKNFGIYAASKAAVLALTRCMALDYGTAGIRVNAILPGTVWTENNARHIQSGYHLGRQEADLHPEIGGLHILKRCADPAEVGEAIAFLCSDSSSFITGTGLVADGGYTAV